MRKPPLKPRSERPPVEGEFDRYIWTLKDIEITKAKDDTDHDREAQGRR